MERTKFLSKKRVLGSDTEVSNSDQVFAEGIPREEVRLRANPRAQAAFQEERQRGYQVGFEEGRSVAYQDAMAEYAAAQERRLKEFCQELQTVVQRIDAGANRYWIDAEESLKVLAVEIARKLCARELQQDPAGIADIVRNALSYATNGKRVRVRVSIGDLSALAERRSELLSSVEGIRELELVSDGSILPGGAVVESETGIVDATFDTQIEEIVNVLHREAA